MPPWFVVPPDDWHASEVALPKEESHHALRVLRVAPPDVITVTDGNGMVARCAAVRVDGDRLIAEVLERDQQRPPAPELIVYQGAAKGHKVDDVVERLAELGVAELSVYSSNRTVVRWGDDKSRRVSERWQTIARSAAKVSRNPFVMRVESALSFTELLRRIAREPLALALWEGASLPMRTAVIKGPQRVALIIGPEGGLEEEEAHALADAGAQLVSLGPHILRTEVAAVVAASGLLWHYGRIG
jgi:16S rRNA (uracil1498-N3)-methyltransferase